MNNSKESEMRKLAGIFLCKLVHNNIQVQEKVCEALSIDLLYANDHIARICLNQMPSKFKKLLLTQNTGLKVIIDQINKLQHNPKQYYWVFPQIVAHKKNAVSNSSPFAPGAVQSLLEDFPDPAEFMIGFFSQRTQKSTAKTSSMLPISAAA